MVLSHRALPYRCYRATNATNVCIGYVPTVPTPPYRFVGQFANTAFKQIRRHHRLAAEYLASMACLHEKNIPLSLLPDASPNHVIDAVAVLVGYSFVRKHTDGIRSNTQEPLYDMHRLVHLTTRNWLRMENSLPYWMMACMRRVAKLFPTRDHKNKGTWTIYLPHGQRLCADRCVEELSERYDLLEKMGLCSFMDGRYNEAVTLHTTVVQWREHKLGTSDQQTLEAFSSLGEALNWRGDWSTAERYLQQAFKGQRETLSQEHPSTMISMANLASTYSNQGRWKEAEELEVQMMDTSLRVLGQEHPFTLISMANLASTF
jgi:tetratricopeptide (TPR) repeat protein